MAEFQEVMRQRERMCASNIVNCCRCPIGKYELCMIPEIDKVVEYEAAIMKWAAENPEVVYPTWEEWQKQTFPDARFPISICHFICAEICPKPESIFGSCEVCRKQPIPADIAKRLGIKPKGVGE